ncbi:MAG TPA: hypothetical protein VFH68_00680 [Polyangia bacterium]|nr:hypothetical protein [Polyangia bacterium]
MTKHQRSPVVGYNHNLRYRGRLFHVQSEDSGPVNPHVFTHLFFEGTILSSKKLQYDAEAHEDLVKVQMQQLHKAMIKELMHGVHDERVTAFFAARGQEAFSEPPRAAAVIVAPAPAGTANAGVPDPAPETGTLPVPAPRLAPPVIQVTGVVGGSIDSGPRRGQAVPAQAKTTPRPVIMVKPMKRSPMVFGSSADGVVVQRNVVIGASSPGTGEMASVTSEPRAPKIRPAAVVGETSAVSPPQHAAGTAAAPAAAGSARGRGAASDKAFSDLVSDKSLDEVILEYLSDDNEPERR